MAAAFAFAHHRHAEADPLYRDALKLAQQGGTAAEQATVQYNLANNLLAQGKFEEAEATYNASAQLCLENQLNPLLAMVPKDEEAVGEYIPLPVIFETT